jgi:inner membrane protein
LSSEAAHFLIGSALALPAIKSRELARVLPAWTIPISSGILATIPDLDLGWKHIFGPAHGNFLGHRGVFHSPFFLVLIAGALAAAFTWRHSRKAFVLLWLLWAGCMITHPLLDSLTTGGGGVMLLLPFSRARIHLAWRPLQTAGTGQSLTERAWMLRPSEIPFCAVAAVASIAGLLIQKPRTQRSS